MQRCTARAGGVAARGAVSSWLDALRMLGSENGHNNNKNFLPSRARQARRLSACLTHQMTGNRSAPAAATAAAASRADLVAQCVSSSRGTDRDRDRGSSSVWNLFTLYVNGLTGACGGRCSIYAKLRPPPLVPTLFPCPVRLAALHPFELILGSLTYA